jgi:hypothetical protein
VGLVVFGFAASGCEPDASRIESGEIAPKIAAGAADRLPLAYQNSQDKINDPRLTEEAQQFKAWALKQREGADPAPLFGRVEILPPTQTVLPYGVGAFQQESRLPVILTTGPGWAGLAPQAKETLVARAFDDLSDRLSALKLNPSPRPTLTIQTPSGLVLGWINDLAGSRKNLHGEGQ